MIIGSVKFYISPWLKVVCIKENLNIERLR